MVDITSTRLSVKSAINGYYNGIIYKVAYEIKTNDKFQTILLEIESMFDNKMQLISLAGDGEGNWIKDGRPANELNGCIDVDIPLTPFTNTLPIKRLQLAKDQSEEIKVVYCDILEQQISSVCQRYTRWSKTSYQYENVPNDFEATILVDENDFVVDYPTLFVRKAALTSRYEAF